jgi:hypothetical protein
MSKAIISSMAEPNWQEIGALGQWASALIALILVVAGAIVSRWFIRRSRPRLYCDYLSYENVELPDGIKEQWIHLPIRAKSKNAPAHNVEVHLLYAYDSTSHQRVDLSILNLKWSRREDLTLALPPAFTRKADIACKVTTQAGTFIALPLLKEKTTDWHAIRTDTFDRYRLGPGQYRLTVAVTADNTDPTYCEIMLHFDGLTLNASSRVIGRREAESQGQTGMAETRTSWSHIKET